MVEALGSDSGFFIPIVPEARPFAELFEAVRKAAVDQKGHVGKSNDRKDGDARCGQLEKSESIQDQTSTSLKRNASNAASTSDPENAVQLVQEKLEQIADKFTNDHWIHGLFGTPSKMKQGALSALVEARGIKEPDTKRLDWLEDRDCDWRSLEFSDQGLRFAIDSELNRYSEPDQE